MEISVSKLVEMVQHDRRTTIGLLSFLSLFYWNTSSGSMNFTEWRKSGTHLGLYSHLFTVVSSQLVKRWIHICKRRRKVSIYSIFSLKLHSMIPSRVLVQRGGREVTPSPPNSSPLTASLSLHVVAVVTIEKRYRALEPHLSPFNAQ